MPSLSSGTEQPLDVFITGAGMAPPEILALSAADVQFVVIGGVALVSRWCRAGAARLVDTGRDSPLAAEHTVHVRVGSAKRIDTTPLTGHRKARDPKR